MKHTVDVLIVGSGTTGCLLALSCRKAGRQVAVVDDNAYGGTRGSLPWPSNRG